jgi:hypothetical protein
MVDFRFTIAVQHKEKGRRNVSGDPFRPRRPEARQFKRDY